MRDERFHKGAKIYNVSGLEYIFKVLLIIAEILFYQSMIPNGVCDVEWRDSIKSRLERLAND